MFFIRIKNTKAQEAHKKHKKSNKRISDFLPLRCFLSAFKTAFSVFVRLCAFLCFLCVWNLFVKKKEINKTSLIPPNTPNYITTNFRGRADNIPAPLLRRACVKVTFKTLLFWRARHIARPLQVLSETTICLKWSYGRAGWLPIYVIY